MTSRRQHRQQQQQKKKNSVTKKYPHLGKKNYYYFFSFSLIQNQVSKSFPNSTCLIINVQSFDEVKKNVKNIRVGGGLFW